MIPKRPRWASLWPGPVQSEWGMGNGVWGMGPRQTVSCGTAWGCAPSAVVPHRRPKGSPPPE